MPPKHTLRKRNCPSAVVCKEEKASSASGEVEERKELPSAPEPKPMSVASKLKKQMLEDSTTNNTADKRVRTDRGRTKDVLCNMKAREFRPSSLYPMSFQKYLQGSHNIIHNMYTSRLGIASSINKKSVLHPVMRGLQDMTLCRTASSFERRITALEWHPTIPNMVVAGSKGGDLMFWNTLNQSVDDKLIYGRGPGGSISGLKIHPFNSQLLFTSSLEGRLTLHDLVHSSHEDFLCTNTWDFWYCSLDVSAPRKIVVTGDNVGNTLLLSMDGQQLWSHRLHKQKVTHAEFSPREDWILCTASTDRTVKVWDVRKISGRNSALEVLKHDKPVNSAYFSRTDGCRLLTTDQFRELRVYLSPNWHLERTIDHPHRFFQYITPIKRLHHAYDDYVQAAWHPLQDLIVVGRYPSKDFPGYTENESRTIDIIDADSGNIVCQLQNPATQGIVALNKFNARGDYLVSGMGLNLLLWGLRHEVEEGQRLELVERQVGVLTQDTFTPVRGGWNSSANPRHRQSVPKQTKSKKEADMKVKVTTKSKAKGKSSK